MSANCGRYRSSSDVRTGLISGDTFDRKQVTYSVIDGMAIFEGDIALGTAEEMKAAVLQPKEAPDLLGIGIKGTSFRWPGGVIPWQAEAQLIPAVEPAMALIESQTPLRFTNTGNRKQYPDYLSFEKLSGCWSYVGRQGGKQQVSLGQGCGGITTVVHEIGHALGLWHEQSRSDRDNYVAIDWDNIAKINWYNFQQMTSDGDDIGTYDYDSAMHYDSYAFAIDSTKPTITKKNGGLIGDNGLSAGDVSALKAMYRTLTLNDWAGSYKTWTRWGGVQGEWKPYHPLKITDKGEVFFGVYQEVQFHGFLFELGSLFKWAPGKLNPEFAGQFQLKNGDANKYFWGDQVISDRCFTGWITTPPNGSMLDFRGLIE